MVGIQSDELLQDIQFKLYDTNATGEVIKVKYKGGWVIVDNGYMKWPTCIPPMKHALSLEEFKWSQWVESMRKDVECTFGILKKRWQVLIHPIRVHSIEKVDMIWKTCCALHNMLLDHDDMNREWSGGFQMDQEDEDQEDEDVPFSVN